MPFESSRSTARPVALSIFRAPPCPVEAPRGPRDQGSVWSFERLGLERNHVIRSIDRKLSSSGSSTEIFMSYLCERCTKMSTIARESSRPFAANRQHIANVFPTAHR